MNHGPEQDEGCHQLPREMDVAKEGYQGRSAALCGGQVNFNLRCNKVDVPDHVQIPEWICSSSRNNPGSEWPIVRSRTAARSIFPMARANEVAGCADRNPTGRDIRNN